VVLKSACLISTYGRDTFVSLDDVATKLFGKAFVDVKQIKKGAVYEVWLQEGACRCVFQQSVQLKQKSYSAHSGLLLLLYSCHLINVNTIQIILIIS
jgi:hypothetical protein